MGRPRGERGEEKREEEKAVHHFAATVQFVPSQ
jgi:hypothetical protein